MQRESRGQRWRRATRRFGVALASLLVATCATSRDDGKPKSASGLQLPLAVLRDVRLPGAANRFDYQELDTVERRLLVTHMNDDSVVALNLDDLAVVKVIPGIHAPRGLALGAGRVFVTSLPSQVVLIDQHTLTEVGRFQAGRGPDGVAYDPVTRVLAVSNQSDGAISLLADAGMGERTQIPLGHETGNVVYDGARGSFWITVASLQPPEQLVEVSPALGVVEARFDLPGCRGAHGLRLHPDGQSAFVACEDNDVLLRVPLHEGQAVVRENVGAGPDVLSIDLGLGWLYVAAESGNLVIFEIGRPGLHVIAREHVGDRAHSVAVDSATHRAFFPLQAGPNGKPVLRVTRPR